MGVASLHQLNRVCGGDTMHYQAGTTCHIALGVMSRPPLPHTQAGRRPLLKCHHHFRVHQMGNTRPVHHLRTWPGSTTPDTSSSPTKFLGDARATLRVSHHPAKPTTAAGAMPQLGHVGIALHPPGHPASHAESRSTHPTTAVQSGVAPIWLLVHPLLARSRHDPHRGIEAH